MNLTLLATALAAALMLQQPSAADRISQADFKKLVAARSVMVVDTRDEHAFERGHIPGAVSLPDYHLDATTPGARETVARLKASTVPIVVYCACPAEITSLRVARLLREQGVGDARALTGGWVDWFNDGNPVEGRK